MLRRDEDAAAEIVATVIVIAITILLSIATYLVISKVTSHAHPTAPSVSMRFDESADRLTVTRADPKADWVRLSLRMSQATGAGSVVLGTDPAPLMNEAAVPGGSNQVAVGGSLAISTASATVTGADYLQMCGTVPMQSVQIQVVDHDAGTVLGSYSIIQLAAC